MDARPFTLRELMAMARGRERAEWQRMLPVICVVTGMKPDEVMPSWLRDPEPATPEPSEGDNRRGLLLMAHALNLGKPPEGW